jgi:4-hydroxy 2-oxovalerate aldolase
LEKINRIRPHAFSIVDTFGSMMKSDLLRIYSLVEHNLDKSIQIGLHLHENLGLAYSLAQYFIEMCASDRKAVIDGSLFGMGRVPGNLCMELIMDYMNKYQSGRYNTNFAYDTIDDYITQLKEIEAWGYSTVYALSAKYNLHRNYSEYLSNIGKLRTKDINQILAGIKGSKKAAYDKDYIEELYTKYQDNTVNDTEAKKKLQQELTGKSVLVLSPGNSLNIYRKNIEAVITENHPVIISANFDDIIFGSTYSFYSSIRRFDQYNQNNDASGKINLITSNIRNAKTDECIVFNYYDLACDESGLFDNCVIMLLRLLYTVGVKEVNIAGFDGFSESNTNYVYKNHISEKKNMEEQNRIIENYVIKLQKKIKINFLTPSFYKKK